MLLEAVTFAKRSIGEIRAIAKNGCDIITLHLVD
jgi:hypothetical protein